MSSSLSQGDVNSGVKKTLCVPSWFTKIDQSSVPHVQEEPPENETPEQRKARREQKAALTEARLAEYKDRINGAVFGHATDVGLSSSRYRAGC